MLAQGFLRVKGQVQITKCYFFVSWRNKYAIIEWPLFDAPTSTHGVFTSFSLSRCCYLHFCRNKFGLMLAQGYLRVNSGNFTVPFGRKRALYELIDSKKAQFKFWKILEIFPVVWLEELRALYQFIGSKMAQIQNLRDHIKKSNSRTYFSFVINLIIRSLLTLRKILGNFPVSFGRKRALYYLIDSKKVQIQFLRDHIKKSNRRTYFSFVINLIIRVSSNPEERFRKFQSAVWTLGALY